MVLEPSIELSLCKINKVINILELYGTYIINYLAQKN